MRRPPPPPEGEAGTFVHCHHPSENPQANGQEHVRSQSLFEQVDLFKERAGWGAWGMVPGVDAGVRELHISASRKSLHKGR